MPFSGAVALVPIALDDIATTSIATLVAPDGTNGNKFPARLNTMLRVVNGSASPITVTLNTNYSRHGLALPDQTFSVPAGADVIITGFYDVFHQNDQNEVWVEFSAVATVTVQVINPL